MKVFVQTDPFFYWVEYFNFKFIDCPKFYNNNNYFLFFFFYAIPKKDAEDMKHKINMIINNIKNCFYPPLLLFESGPYIAWAPVNLSSKSKLSSSIL